MILKTIIISPCCCMSLLLFPGVKVSCGKASMHFSPFLELTVPAFTSDSLPRLHTSNQEVDNYSNYWWWGLRRHLWARPTANALPPKNSRWNYSKALWLFFLMTFCTLKWRRIPLTRVLQSNEESALSRSLATHGFTLSQTWPGTCVMPWGTCSGLLLLPLLPPVASLTNDHEDEEGSGHSSADVQHDSDVLRQLVDVLHVGHQHWWDQKAKGDTQLWD